MCIFSLFLMMACSVVMAADIAPFSVCYLEKDSADLMQNPTADSPVLEKCPHIFYGEKLIVLKAEGDWLQVLVAGGWSGWIKYRDDSRKYIAAEIIFCKDRLTFAEALQNARETARGWASDATPILAYALGILPSGLAETWSVAFWSGTRNGYLVVEQSKSSSKKTEYKTFPDVAGFDPYAYDHRGWAKPLLENVLDSDAIMESAWTHLRSEWENICTLTIYRGPNPITADAEHRTGFIPPWGEDIWYVRVNHSDQSYQVLLLDLGGTYKGTVTFGE